MERISAWATIIAGGFVIFLGFFALLGSPDGLEIWIQDNGTKAFDATLVAAPSLFFIGVGWVLSRLVGMGFMITREKESETKTKVRGRWVRSVKQQGEFYCWREGFRHAQAPADLVGQRFPIGGYILFGTVSRAIVGHDVIYTVTGEAGEAWLESRLENQRLNNVLAELNRGENQ